MSFMKFFRKNRERAEKSSPESSPKETREKGKTAVTSSSPPTPQPNLSRLRQRLSEQFSENELAALAQQLDVHYSLLPGITKEAKARELIAYLQRRGRLDELEAACQEMKPGSREQTAAAEAPPSPAKEDSLPEQEHIVQVLITYFNLGEIKTLCFDLGIDFDLLTGEEKKGKAIALVNHFEEQGQLLQLVQKIKDMRHNVDFIKIAQSKTTARDVDDKPSQKTSPQGAFEKKYRSSPDLALSKTLSQVMRKNLNEVEVREIAFDLGVNYADLSGIGFGYKVRELVEYARRRVLLDDLLTICRSRYPDIDWKESPISQAGVEEKPTPNPPGSQSVPRPPIRLKPARPTSAKVNHAVLAQLLRENCTSSNLRELCFELGIDYENLGGIDRASKSRELVVYIMQQPQSAKRTNRAYLSDLLAVCYRMRPDVDWPAVLNEEDAVLATAVTYYPHGYDIANLRKLLLNTFSDDETFTAFCNKHFPQIRFSFGVGISFREKVQILLEYAQRHRQFQTLLEIIAETYPEEFAQYGPYEVESDG
jgi:antitoxin component of MazEF toxin-antitoxin module